MDVKINRIDDIRPSGYNCFLADIDFSNEDDVIQEFGAKKCAEALDEKDLYEAFGGWENAKSFFSDEIEELTANK